MKRLLLYARIFLLIGIFSCNKNNDEITNPSQFPEWLQTKITELDPDKSLCEITDVTIIDYKGKTYYHIYCGIWSCVYCQLFDEQGNRPTWETSEWNDFFANKKNIKTIPACQ